MLFGWASNFTVALGAKRKKRVASGHNEQTARRHQWKRSFTRLKRTTFERIADSVLVAGTNCAEKSGDHEGPRCESAIMIACIYGDDPFFWIVPITSSVSHGDNKVKAVPVAGAQPGLVKVRAANGRAGWSHGA